MIAIAMTIVAALAGGLGWWLSRKRRADLDAQRRVDAVRVAMRELAALIATPTPPEVIEERARDEDARADREADAAVDATLATPPAPTGEPGGTVGGQRPRSDFAGELDL